MARKKFEDGFKENAILYCQTHSDKTIKACAADLGIGYSTLRRWIAQSEEAEAAAVEEVAMEEVAEEVVETEEVEAPEEAVEAPVEVEENSDEDDQEVVVEESVVEAAVSEVEVLDAPKEEVPEAEEATNKREQVIAQIEGFIETAGSGVSDAVQLFGLYKKRHDLKKVQKKLQKEKERRLKK